MKTIGKAAALSAVSLLALGTLAACGSSDSADNTTSGEGSATTGDVQMVFWHNSTTGEGKAYWENTVKAFEDSHPGVTIEVQAIQNEDMDGKLQNALQAGDAPDIFMARGGGKLQDIVDAGMVMDIRDKVTPETEDAVGGTLSAFAFGDGYYGMPVSILPGGIFYSSDLLDEAGIKDTPKTIAELEQTNETLRAAGIEPIALGAKDAWPAAHWYYFFALRECPREVIEEDGAARELTNECWDRAGQQLEDFVATNPFNSGYLTTSAQQGAGSSAGMLANHQAAMELMGAWNPGVIGDLTPDGKPLADLRWFPFPEIDGGEGAPGAMMGGVDGFSCHVDAPDACPEFLNFMVEKQYQEEYADAFTTLPASKEAQGVVTDPALQDILAAYNEAPYTIIWMDTLLGQNVGNAMNAAVVDVLAGNLPATDLVKRVNDTAAKG